jgi:hypothetical protein
MDRTTADEAITMLEEVIEALKKCELEPRHTLTVDSSSALPLPRGWR